MDGWMDIYTMGMEGIISTQGIITQLLVVD